ncbi:carboxy terminal-processing peptidase [Constantimarinum furrinae]|uniref:Carboxyl-terminal protease n=1 Tax=Constantimarinum furrinae TaxID=2562285 RepID=A0A7G8PWY1_9FLAO|nr:carboxy terminal-processing peptidase [Constantimarinum furrinae]QNJ98847.1 Carboxyl-terminal protease [Constantimarinum furrinae]
MIKRLVLVLLLCCATEFYAQDDAIFCEQVSALSTLIEKEHYRPKPIDDSLSVAVQELFLLALDEDKWLFTTSDIEEFNDDRFKIDDYILKSDCGFIDKYIARLRLRIERAKKHISSFTTVPFDYSGTDTLHFYRTRPSRYFSSDSAAKRNWNKRIRYTLLSKLIEEDTIFENIEKNFSELEKAIKPKVFQNQICLLDERLNAKGGLEHFVKEAFLNAFANYQDPNSFFFNDTEKVVFENSVSNSQLSFGLYTAKNDDGEIVISYITPGGAAYLNGNFEENDVIKSLSSGTTVLETFCVSNEEIFSFMADNKHNKITFRIKKKDGTIKYIPLEKSIEEVEENLTRGYVITKDKTDFGYLNIPSFYTDLESPNGFGVANDVAKELYKLEKEKIKGLIIDLRFNGGGSMKEAADLCGLFIDRGPLSILRYRDGETFTIRDAHRGTAFDKPIVILINNYSASASEFFSSVMQDYNRAVIVGAPSYGKSSAQVIFPLSESKDLGYCKLTVDAFYRVTGKSNQSRGVIPDIRFPSIYDGLKINEEYERFALPNDSVRVSLRHIPLKSLPLDAIASKSVSRINTDKSFQLIKSLNQTLIQNYVTSDTEYPLTLSDVYKDLEGYNNLWKEMTMHFEKRNSNMTARNTKTTTGYLKYNEDEKELNAVILKDLAEDLYVEEAHAILLDFIRLTK